MSLEMYVDFLNVIMIVDILNVIRNVCGHIECH